ncbi:HNH endonuclease [Thermoactinomyces sp. DSM 45892]|nr:HNH endonuclease [Thermoactinomyces sp. DSM 45892]
MMVVLIGFSFVGSGVTYAVDFNIDNIEIDSHFPTDLAGEPTTEVSWWDKAGDWVSDKWNGFTDWCGELWDDVNNILDDLGAKIKSIKDNLWEWGLTIGAGVTLAWAILKKQFPMLKVLEWATYFLKGVLRGLVDMLIGVFDLALGAVGLLGYVILNPRESWNQLKHWATHPGEVWDNISNAAGGIWKEITESWDRMVINGDGKSRSEWFGYAFSQLLGLKGVDKAGKAGNVVSKSGGLSSKFPLTSKAFDAISDSLTGLGDKVKSFGDNLFGSGKRILATTTAGAVAVTGLTFAWPKIEPLLMKFKDCVAVQQQDTGHYLASMQLAGKIDCPSGKAETGSKSFTKGGNENFTKELLETKPKNSPVPKKWLDKGGSISIDENKVWTYTNKNGVSIRYPDGYPDFSRYQHPVVAPVKINFTSTRRLDFKEANLKAGLGRESTPSVPASDRPPTGYTWHHHQDGETMMLVDYSIHREFTHVGGVSLNK